MIEGNATIIEDQALQDPSHFYQILSQQLLFGRIIFLKRSKRGQRPTVQSMCVSCKEKVFIAPLVYPDTLENPDFGIIKGLPLRFKMIKSMRS